MTRKYMPENKKPYTHDELYDYLEQQEHSQPNNYNINRESIVREAHGKLNLTRFVRENDLIAIDILIEYGLNIDRFCIQLAYGDEACSLIKLAIENNSLEVLKHAIFRGANLNYRTSIKPFHSNINYLSLAADEDDDCFNYLLPLFSKEDAQDAFEEMLKRASECKYYNLDINIVKALLDRGISIDRKIEISDRED